MTMLSGKGMILKVFIGESDMCEGIPLYEAIVLEAKKLGLAGATVTRGIMGFGANTRVIHTAKILRLSEDLPVVVEIVDAEDKVKKLRAFLETHVKGGLVTTEEVNILKYSHNG
ncbi:MAG: DUF190 domain-containing protein [Nitrospinae bacterium]|nr:DUF190 domain-containing protein [Nitrospinota bacterium]